MIRRPGVNNPSFLTPGVKSGSNNRCLKRVQSQAAFIGISWSRVGDLAVEDVRIGGSYVAVVLTGGRIGLAARLKESVGTQIEIPRSAICGKRAEALLEDLVSGTGAVERALGLAAANAIIHPAIPRQEEDTIGLMNLRPGERVAMVGLFRPIVPRIEATGVIAFRHRAGYAGDRDAGTSSGPAAWPSSRQRHF